MTAVHFAHHTPVRRDERLHQIRFVEDLVVLLGVELARVALAGVPVRGAAGAGVPGIMMQRESPSVVQGGADLVEEAARPAQLARVGTGGNELQTLAVARRPRRVAAVLDGV